MNIGLILFDTYQPTRYVLSYFFKGINYKNIVHFQICLQRMEV